MCGNYHPVRFAGSAESAVIQQYFSLTTNQRTVLSTAIIQRNDHGVYYMYILEQK
jgi:hypothetical protein